MVFALLAACGGSSLIKSEKNPDFAAKPFNNVLVVAVHADELVRRPFEDRIVARLKERGHKGIPSYDLLGRGKVDEARLRAVVGQSGADAVLITRVTGVNRPSWTLPGATIAYGVGWGGFYGYYDTLWTTSEVPAQQISGTASTFSETRLFDARNGTLVWSGVMETRDGDDISGMMTQYIQVIFDAMVSDRVL